MWGQVGIVGGLVNGIRLNDPVVNADGLVGLVTQVAHNTAEVTLLTDPNLKVSALDLTTKAAGVVAGAAQPGGDAGATSAVPAPGIFDA